MVEFLWEKIENILGKGASVGYHLLFSFPTMFSKAFFPLGQGIPESKESTPLLVFTSTKWARTSDISDMVVRQDE